MTIKSFDAPLTLVIVKAASNVPGSCDARLPHVMSPVADFTVTPCGQSNCNTTPYAFWIPQLKRIGAPLGIIDRLVVNDVTVGFASCAKAAKGSKLPIIKAARAERE